MTSNDETRNEVSIVPVRAAIPENDVIGATWRALETVYDPELCLDVVSLGLVYDVREEDGTIVVVMTLTTPGCPASESLAEMTRAAIVRVAGGSTPVDVRLVWDPPWSPAMINAEAAAALGFRVR
jgi:metal-sulfur cluster biosynthetic enzyme